MTTVNLIHQHTIQADQLRSILAQGNISINEISQGDPLHIEDGTYPCIHLLEDAKGLSIQE